MNNNKNNTDISKSPLGATIPRLACQDIGVFFHQQLADWPLAGQNYRLLEKVRTKNFDFGKFSVRVQYNPGRIQSSTAKVDTKSIQERKCFLCPAHLPAEQKGIPFGKDYQVLVNPFPIFPIHFTIPALHHTDQLICCRYEDMLQLAESLKDFVIFYNGPKCGASAPDHVHFQAGNKGFLPLEKDIRNVDKNLITSTAKIKIYSLRNYLRNVFVMESEDKNEMLSSFNRIYSLMDIKEGEKEPMMNIIMWHEDNKWISCIFPREAHRPSCFYEEGEKNILLSPGSVDMGGVFITPQEKDFIKITATDIENILKEVSINDQTMIRISEGI